MYEKITVFHENDFQGLALLERLSLYNNQLTEFPERISQDLTSVKYLNLSDNQFFQKEQYKIRYLFPNTHLML